MASSGDVGRLVYGTLANASKRNADELTSTMELASLGVDSLSLTILIAQIEARFAVTLTPDEKMSIYDAGSIADLVGVAEAAVSGG